MSVLTGLDAIRKKIESRPSAGERVDDRELTRNIKSGGERTIRFVQELDTNAKGYDEKYGTAVVAVEYEHPKYYWLKLVDTFEEEGECWAAEQGWQDKVTLYVNVVDVDTGEVFYLQRSVLGGLGEQIIEAAHNRGSLTDSVWKIKKKGSGLGTNYTFSFLDLTDEELDVDPEELVDFRKSVLKVVPSAEQAQFVRSLENRMANKEQEASDTGGSPDNGSGDGDVW